jgi:homoserine O-acetyltransferase/O-succinyltransferase
MMMSTSVMARGTDLGRVEDQSFPITNFRLENGAAMPQARLAYETYGRPAVASKNAMLITHVYTSSHDAAGRNPLNGKSAGLAGWPDRHRQALVSSNMLGSSLGSTKGASINPDTGKPYGPDFPAITVHLRSHPQ